MDLNYKVYGEGEPVVILHGLFGMLDNWQTFAKALAEDYMVYVVDQRDHGRSPRSDDFNYQLLAEDLSHFCEQHWLHEARFIGHSMGGKTLLQFAKEYQDIIQQMVIVDMGIKAYTGGHETILQALSTLDVEVLDSRGAAEDHLSQTIGERGVRQFLLKNLTRRKEGGYAWKMNLPLLVDAYPNILAAIDYDHTIDTDTLFVRGSKSNYVADEDIASILETYTHARVETVDDAGHWIHAERPTELLAMVRSFFASKT
jgi:pimeloyl-ACP methyl ester carboxylesterase